jgi:hypothetical protein
VTPVLVTARLARALCGAAPQLDSLLVKARCRFHPSAGAHERYDPAPALATLPPTPLVREWLGPWLVHRCSSPILAETLDDRHERIANHFPREHATQLRESDRGVIATTNGSQKSMWLPVRLRVVERVAWFAVCDGSPSELRKELRRSVTHIGQDRSRGHGRVAEWIVEQADGDCSWYAPHPDGPVLMRQLPVGDWLPANLLGARRDYDAVCPPYWHPERKTEIVAPC